MNPARHPTWRWIKRETITPSTLSRVLRGVASIALGWMAYRFTGKAIWLMVVFYSSLILPTVIVTLLDTILRVQFSLRTLVVAIVTLQIPMLLFFTTDAEWGRWVGAALLLLWLLVLSASLNIRPADPEKSNEAGRWKRIDPDEVSPKSEKSAD